MVQCNAVIGGFVHVGAIIVTGFFFLANEIYVISDMLHFFSQNQIFDLFLFHTVLFPLCSVPTYF